MFYCLVHNREAYIQHIKIEREGNNQNIYIHSLRKHVKSAAAYLQQLETRRGGSANSASCNTRLLNTSCTFLFRPNCFQSRDINTNTSQLCLSSLHNLLSQLYCVHVVILYCSIQFFILFNMIWPLQGLCPLLCQITAGYV